MALLPSPKKANGYRLNKSSKEDIKVIKEVALDIGLAFQIQDDVLDVISTDEELGKPVNSDQKNEKMTYVNLVGIDKAKELVKEHTDRALNSLASIDGDNEFLCRLLEQLVYRKN